MEPHKLAESELIVNPDGSIYHLHLFPKDVADTVIVVGDQDRVKQVSAHFDNIEVEVSNREFITHTGTYKGNRITVLSTGIGTDNIDIVVHELDAAVNINFDTRQPHPEQRSLRIVRLGTCGAVQPDIPVDSFVVSAFGLGFDGLLHYYERQPTEAETQLENSLVKHLEWDPPFSRPYVVQGDPSLVNLLSEGNFKGITATAPGFYGPQGRKIRIPLTRPDINDKVTSFSDHGQRITNFEMETSALYGLGELLGHNCCTVCAVIANRVRGEFNEHYRDTVDRMIVQVLDRLTAPS